MELDGPKSDPGLEYSESWLIMLELPTATLIISLAIPNTCN